jgi:hypothetical protein
MRDVDLARSGFADPHSRGRNVNVRQAGLNASRRLHLALRVLLLLRALKACLFSLWPHRSGRLAGLLSWSRVGLPVRARRTRERSPHVLRQDVPEPSVPQMPRRRRPLPTGGGDLRTRRSDATAFAQDGRRHVAIQWIGIAGACATEPAPRATATALDMPGPRDGSLLRAGQDGRGCALVGVQTRPVDAPDLQIPGAAGFALQASQIRAAMILLRSSDVSGDARDGGRNPILSAAMPGSRWVPRESTRSTQYRGSSVTAQGACVTTRIGGAAGVAGVRFLSIPACRPKPLTDDLSFDGGLRSPARDRGTVGTRITSSCIGCPRPLLAGPVQPCKAAREVKTGWRGLGTIARAEPLRVRGIETGVEACRPLAAPDRCANSTHRRHAGVVPVRRGRKRSGSTNGVRSRPCAVAAPHRPPGAPALCGRARPGGTSADTRREACR